MTSEQNVTGLVGRRLGAYEIVEQVGHGGMGAVYRAHDRSLDRDVALKVLLPEYSRDAEYEQRFVREARAAARLDHPNIVQVHAAGKSEGVLFIAMQFVKGKTLAQLQRERGDCWEPKEALGIVRQGAEALDAAHKVGLVHRDIKPTNLMIDESGRVKIMDFGLARSSLSPDRITQTGVFFGTPEYASPEQCETSRVDGRSDIYSLGAVLYEMLTGRVPHVAETPIALFKKISQEDAADVSELNPMIPRPVVSIVRRMIARRTEERYASCADLIADIDRFLEGRPVAAAKVGPGRKRRAALAGVAVVGALLVAGLMWVLMSTLGGAAPLRIPGSGKLGLIVFDFRNGKPVPEDDWYSIALSDMLITSLAQNEFLSVPTRDQLLWKAQDRALGEGERRRLVEEFGAAAYITGSYYVQDGRIWVTATCYRARDNVPAFPPLKFDRPEAGVFSLVDEMAATVSMKLKGTEAGPVAARTCQELLLARLERRPDGGPVAMADMKNTEYQKARKVAAAPAQPEGASSARGAVMELEKKGFVGEIALDADTLRHLYRTRQTLEAAGWGAEETRLAAGDLDQQMQLDDSALLARRLESFRQFVADVSKAKGNCEFRLRREHMAYVCTACPGVSGPRPGSCDRCGGTLVISARLPVAGEKKP